MRCEANYKNSSNSLVSSLLLVSKHEFLFLVNSNLHDDDVEVYPLDLLNSDHHGKAFQHVIDKFGEVRAFMFHANGDLEIKIN